MIRRASRGEEFDRPRVESAIIDEVVERGYLAASVDGICTRAEISTEQFHAHFKDLEDAYCQVGWAYWNMVAERVLATFGTDEPWRRQMRAAAHAYLDFLEEDPRRKRFVHTEIFHAGEEAQLIREEGVKLMAQLIDQGRTHLPDPSLLTFSTAEGIAGSLFQQIREAVERDEDGGALIPEFMYTVVAPYLGVDAALAEYQAEELTPVGSR